MSWLEIIAVVTSATGIWLSTRRNLLSWPITLLACAFYAALFHQARLYSDMMLQGVYAVFSVYGWWNWAQGKREEGTVLVHKISPIFLGASLATGIVLSLLLGTLMARYTNAALPHLDSALTAFSLVAQAWTTRRFIANWILWMTVDGIYAGVFAFKHLYLTSALYAFFILLAWLGWKAWQDAFKSQQHEEEVRKGFVPASVTAG